jgi:hypothetical protein
MLAGLFGNILLPKNVPWAKIGVVVLILALLGGTFYLGRRYAPVKTVTVDKVTETHHETQVVQQQVDIQAIMHRLDQFSASLNSLVNISKTTQKTITTITKPDGTKISKETDTTDLNKKSATSQTTTNTTTIDTKANTTAITNTTTKVDDTKTETKTVQTGGLSDKWRLTIEAGYSIPTLWRSEPNYLPGLPNGMVIGATVDRQLFWGFSAGLHLDSRLDATVLLLKGF